MSTNQINDRSQFIISMIENRRLECLAVQPLVGSDRGCGANCIISYMMGVLGLPVEDCAPAPQLEAVMPHSFRIVR